MTDLSDYELRVLRQMATGKDEGLFNGAALWTACCEVLLRRGLVERLTEYGGPEASWVTYVPTDAGRALVRARALDELMANDAELTTGPRTLVSELADKGFQPGDESGANINAGKLTEAPNGHH